MMSVLLGAAAGALAAVFGLRCYIKGENNGLRLAKNEPARVPGFPAARAETNVPGKTRGPAEAEEPENGIPYEKQLRNILAYNPELPADKEEG